MLGFSASFLILLGRQNEEPIATNWGRSNGSSWNRRDLSDLTDEDKGCNRDLDFQVEEDVIEIYHRKQTEEEIGACQACSTDAQEP